MNDGIFPGLESFAREQADARKREETLKALDKEKEDAR